jgi:hypothetical protein
MYKWNTAQPAHKEQTTKQVRNSTETAIYDLPHNTQTNRSQAQENKQANQSKRHLLPCNCKTTKLFMKIAIKKVH